MELAEMIERKSALPPKYTTNIPFSEIKKELTKIKSNYLQLPNFSLSPNILRLMIGIKYLKKDFPEEHIIISSVLDR